MRILAQDQERQKFFEVSLVRHFADKAAHVVRSAGFPRTSVAVFPSEFAAHSSDGFRSLAEGFEVHVQRVVAVEMRKGVDAVAQALDEVMELRALDDLAVGFQERGREETHRYPLTVNRHTLSVAR